MNAQKKDFSCKIKTILFGIENTFNAYATKNIRRCYGKITGNQLPVHFPLFFTCARKHFQEYAQ